MNKVLTILSFLVSFTIYSYAQESTLSVYVGKYVFPEGSAVPYVEVKLTDSTLTSESPMGSATLQKIEGDLFSIVEYNGIAEFKRNADGKVASVKVSVMGIEMEGTKEETAFRDFLLLLLSGKNGLISDSK